MSNIEKVYTIPEEIEMLEKALTTGRNISKLKFTDFTAEQIKQSMHPVYEISNPIVELVATAEAVFTFIRQADLKKSERQAFLQLEKQFEFLRNLVLQE